MAANTNSYEMFVFKISSSAILHPAEACNKSKNGLLVQQKYNEMSNSVRETISNMHELLLKLTDIAG